jgi:hypothetical protein
LFWFPSGFVVLHHFSTKDICIMNVLKKIKESVVGTVLNATGVESEYANQKSIIEGWLTKRALKSAKNWDVRYFELYPTALVYYADAESNYPRGEMKFTEEFFVSDSTLRHNAFQVSDLETTYYLQAESLPEKMFWMHTIAKVLRTLSDEGDSMLDPTIRVASVRMEEVIAEYASRRPESMRPAKPPPPPPRPPQIPESTEESQAQVLAAPTAPLPRRPQKPPPLPPSLAHAGEEPSPPSDMEDESNLSYHRPPISQISDIPQNSLNSSIVRESEPPSVPPRPPPPPPKPLSPSCQEVPPSLPFQAKVCFPLLFFPPFILLFSRARLLLRKDQWLLQLSPQRRIQYMPEILDRLKFQRISPQLMLVNPLPQVRTRVHCHMGNYG